MVAFAMGARIVATAREWYTGLFCCQFLAEEGWLLLHEVPAAPAAEEPRETKEDESEAVR